MNNSLHSEGAAKMNMHRTACGILGVFLICYLCGIASGENSQNARVSFNKISVILRPYLNALGARVKGKGREKTVFDGEYFESGKSCVTRVVLQLPRMARLEGFKGANSVLAFDGKSKKSATDRRDDALLDTFLIDTAEGMFASVQELSSFRPLGLAFKPDPRKFPNYSGPEYDIYDVNTARLGNSGLQSRRYYFDSKTQLLQKTAYTDTSVSPPVKIETRFLTWGNKDGSAYPACFERYENGKRVFSFIATSIESAPADDIANYR
jgi:hypothetical protein